MAIEIFRHLKKKLDLTIKSSYYIIRVSVPMELEQFAKLEAKALELSRRYKSLKEEKERLDVELRAARERAEELETELGELKSARGEILRRVDDLIRHLESEGPQAGELTGEENGPAA